MRNRLTVTIAAAVATMVLGIPAASAHTFGSVPYSDTLGAADAYDNECTQLTKNDLTLMLLAPTYPETGAPSSQAPSPMTLSRGDDQVSLHSFGSGSSYKRAFWHPGVGAWQMDSAGLGAPNDARKRVSTWYSSRDAADEMATRYCLRRNQGYSAASARDYAWGPWYGCDAGSCETFFNGHRTSGGGITGIYTTSSVERYGGVQWRTCSIFGNGSTFTCWYVKPANAQGYNGFAVWTPLDGGTAGSGTSPITHPFYTYTSSNKEYRYWFTEDTGYGQRIFATRTLGTNARGGLTWYTWYNLCDRSYWRGNCSNGPV